MGAGYLLYKRISKLNIVMVSLLSLCLFSMELLNRDFSPLQLHKFPPDVVFVAYNIIILCLLTFMGRVKLPDCNIFQIWNKRGYTIYLYQSVVFFFLSKLKESMPDVNVYINIILFSLLSFIISTLLSYLTYPLEKIMLNKIIAK